MGDGEEPELGAQYTLAFQGPTGEPLEGGGSVREETPGARVEFEVSGLPPGEYASVLRQGTCDAPGAVDAELGPVLTGDSGSGGASAHLERDAAEVAAGHHVAVLDGEQTVACGEIVPGG